MSRTQERRWRERTYMRDVYIQSYIPVATMRHSVHSYCRFSYSKYRTSDKGLIIDSANGQPTTCYKEDILMQRNCTGTKSRTQFERTLSIYS